MTLEELRIVALKEVHGLTKLLHKQNPVAHGKYMPRPDGKGDFVYNTPESDKATFKADCKAQVAKVKTALTSWLKERWFN